MEDDDDDFEDWLIAREECIMDLDDEELKATRKLNGVVKESNLEEDIMSEEAFNELIDNLEVVETLTLYGRKGIKENVKKLQKKIKELEVLEDDLKDKRVAYIDTPEFAENYIPVQKVKDKIEELKKDYEDSKDENGETEYYYPDYTIRKLEELLEDK